MEAAQLKNRAPVTQFTNVRSQSPQLTPQERVGYSIIDISLREKKPSLFFTNIKKYSIVKLHHGLFPLQRPSLEVTDTNPTPQQEEEPESITRV